MAALAGPRATPETSDINRVFPVAAAVKCWQGGLAMLVGGYVKPGAVANNGVCVGRFEAIADNLSGSAGAITAAVKRGCFKWGNAAADAVPASQVGKNCFILDDQTVAATDGGAGARSVAGVVHQVDADGVWVRTP